VAEQRSEAVLSRFSRLLIVSDVALAVFEPEAVAVELEDVNVVSRAIEQRGTSFEEHRRSRRPRPRAIQVS